MPPRLRGGHPKRRNSYSHRPMGLLQLPAYRRDGVEFPAEISLAPIATDESHLTVATVRDISERLRLEAEADRMRDELLATISHELRTPLTSIIGYTELLEDLERDAMSPLGRDMLAKVRRNAGRELRLVDDLLTLAVGQPRSHAPAARRTSTCSPSSARSSSDRRHEARRRGLVIAVHSARGTLHAVCGDRHRLTQALDNLVANAVKFTATGGRVDVTVSTSPTAPSSPSPTPVRGSPRPSRRASSSGSTAAATPPTRRCPAPGSGLALVKGIVEAHQGSVALRSELGVGTTVTVQLPHRPPRD